MLISMRCIVAADIRSLSRSSEEQQCGPGGH
jgi:hypothetical protein